MIRNGGNVEQEMVAESEALELNEDSIDRVLVARLIESPQADYPQAPVHYLLGCYQRALDMSASKTPGAQKAARALQTAAQNHIWLCLADDVIPQPPAATERGALQLFDALWASVPHTPTQDPSAGCVAMPPGFLDQAARECAGELAAQLPPVLGELADRARRTRVLDDTTALTTCWYRLVETKALAGVIAAQLHVAQKGIDGRAFESLSPLAALFAISAVPDPLRTVAAPTDMADDVGPLVRASEQHVSGLQQLLAPKTLLGKDARGATLAWLRSMLASDRERCKHVMDVRRALSDGCVLNTASVLLHLSAPFLDFYSGKACQFIDARCTFFPPVPLIPLFARLRSLVSGGPQTTALGSVQLRCCGGGRPLRGRGAACSLQPRSQGLVRGGGQRSKRESRAFYH